MIIRRIDELGRLVIPREMRRVLGIEQKDPIEISIEGSKIILHKHEGRCSFCGSDKTLMDFKNKKICVKCLREIKDV